MADQNTKLTDVVWLSPNEHDPYMPVVQALTSDGKLWSWGSNHQNTLGPGGVVSDQINYVSQVGVDPRFMTGGLDPVNDRILAVETGGHISTIFKGCEYKLGYIGHAINGSYASEDRKSTRLN